MEICFISSLYNEDIDISKLVAQLRLLPGLFEIKDNGSVGLSTIIKNLQDMSRNRRFLISEVEKIVRFTFTFTCHKCRKLRDLFCFEAPKDIPQVNYGKQPTTCTNVDAYSQKYIGYH